MRQRFFSVFLLTFLFMVLGIEWALLQDNPVIERVADAGIINFNGQYYLAGVFTNGGFYVSDDLINWSGPVHVFSKNNDWTKGRSAGDDQIHAADIHYWNGKFHFYWSVNHWGLRDMVVHIGHAASDNILGPFEVFIDGLPVYNNTGSNYSTISLGNDIIQNLRKGNNIISIHSKSGRRSAHIDVELVDNFTNPGDDILYNPGQPNIIRGPNGFEWWLVYFGIKNGGKYFRILPESGKAERQGHTVPRWKAGCRNYEVMACFPGWAFLQQYGA